MGKAKDVKGEPSGSSSLTRMNYLYQASQLVSKLPDNTSLACYYGKVMKEIAMKTVEKVHPDIKRTICKACNYSLTGSSDLINANIKTHPKRKLKRKHLKSIVGSHKKKLKGLWKVYNNESTCDKYKTNQVTRRIKKPNKLSYSCTRCGFTKSYIQKPNYDIWINKMNGT